MGNFPLESALDELSYALGIDPVDLRLRNHADVNPQSGRPWSSNALRECYLAGAAHFGWACATPRSGRCATVSGSAGDGMAGVTATDIGATGNPPSCAAHRRTAGLAHEPGRRRDRKQRPAARPQSGGVGNR